MQFAHNMVNEKFRGALTTFGVYVRSGCAMLRHTAMLGLGARSMHASMLEHAHVLHRGKHFTYSCSMHIFVPARML